MIKTIYTICLCLTLIPSGIVIGSTSYHVGNSLTDNMQPDGFAAMAALSGKNHQVGYHIKGGKDLNFIWNNPDLVDGYNSFGRFIDALPSYEWDDVTIQPYYREGSTLALDQAAISNFINLTLTGPSTSPTFYIYSAWPSIPADYQTYWDQIIYNTPDQVTIHAREYFNLLYQNLSAQYGSSAQINMIPIGEVMYRLDQEFKQGNIPGYEDVGDLYMDDKHLTADVGQFIAGTTVYSTIFKENPVGIERPIGYYGGPTLTDELRNQFQSIVWDVVSNHPLSGVDVTPDNFTLGNILDSKLSVMNYSEQISVLGINAASFISITRGEYSINDGSYTSSLGTVINGDTIVVRHTSASIPSISMDTVLTIGRVSDTFTSTTADDLEPDAFSFNDQINVPVSSRITSNPVTIIGISVDAVISITSGEYSINGSEFTNNEGVLSENNVVVVRLISSGSYSAEVAAKLTIGEVSDTFSATTIEEPVISTIGQPIAIRAETGSLNIAFIILLFVFGLARLKVHAYIV